MYKDIYLGKKETPDQMMVRCTYLSFTIAISLLIAIGTQADEHPAFLLYLLALVLPMSFRLGRLMFPKTDYVKLISDMRKNTTQHKK